MKSAVVTLFLVLSALTGCRNSSSGPGEASPGTGSIGEPGTRQFSSNCGVISQGSVRNPVNEQQGIVVQIKAVASPNTVIVGRADGDQLIKFVGVADSQSVFSATRARAILERSLGAATLFYADESCQVTTVGGGTGTLGTLYRNDGVNLNELLIEEANATAETGLACGTESVRNCFVALDEETKVETGAAVSNFLWKPAGEHSGQLVVLMNPLATTITANGELLVYTGPSNGRATTARGSKPGCAYGGNVKVEAFDSQGRVLVFPGGELSFTIPSGCDRVEF